MPEETEVVETSPEADANQLEFDELFEDFFDDGSTVDDVPADSPEEGKSEEVEAASEEEAAPEAEAEEEEAEVESKEEETTEVLSEVEALRNQLAEMAKQLQEVQQSKPEDVLDPESVPEAVAFVQEEAFDEALTSAEGMNKLLQGVYTKAVATAREEFIKQAPGLVTPMVTDIVNRTQMVNEFYTKNQDLVNMKDYVGFVGKEIASKNPEFTLAQVMEKIAPEVRKRMGMTGTAKDKPKAKAGIPAPRTTRQPTPKQLKGLEADVADLLDL